MNFKFNLFLILISVFLSESSFANKKGAGASGVACIKKVGETEEIGSCYCVYDGSGCKAGYTSSRSPAHLLSCCPSVGTVPGLDSLIRN